MTPRLALPSVFVLAGLASSVFAAEMAGVDDGEKLSAKLGWDLRQQQEVPVTAAAVASVGRLPATTASSLSPATTRLARPLDASTVPNLVMPPAPTASVRRLRPGLPRELAGAAGAAMTEVRSYASAPRPPGGIPTEQLEPAARAMAQLIAGEVSPRVPAAKTASEQGSYTTRLQPLTLSSTRAERPAALDGWSARKTGDGLLLKPAVKLAPGMDLGAELAVPAVSAEPDRGVLRGNPMLTAGLALGEKGKTGATRLDLGYRPDGRERTEFARLRGETTLLAKGGAVVKLKGDMALSPVAETAYTVGVSVVARLF